MTTVINDFQVFVKPVGGACNLDCRYCYYIDRKVPAPNESFFRMPDIILEEYIVQHIEASPEEVIRFSWHGGEPTLAGLDYYQRIVELQQRHCPPGRTILNGIQTNGILIDENWGRFLGEQRFSVGLSLDGTDELHDLHRIDRRERPTFDRAMKGYENLRKYGVAPDVLCVVNAENSRCPLQVYRFFKEIGAGYITFLPLVERLPVEGQGVDSRSISPAAWGEFLCTVFDEWVAEDIGTIKVQIFEEALRTAFGLEHSLCIFRPVCGDIPALDKNGNLYSCDHFVDREHLVGNIIESSLEEMLTCEAQREFGRNKRVTLPGVCLDCEVLAMCNGECPKNRFTKSSTGEGGLNYLCEGYKRFFLHCRPFAREVAREWKKA